METNESQKLEPQGSEHPVKLLNLYRMPPPKRLLYIAGIIIPLTAWAIFLFKQYEQLQTHHWEFSGVGLAGALLSGCLYFINLALGWALLLQSMTIGHHRKVSLPNAMRVWLLTIMSRYLPGNIWHILSRMAFAKQLKVSRLQMLSSSTIEQGLVVIGAMVIAAVSLPFSMRAAQLQQYSGYIILSLSALGLGLLFLHPRILGALLQWAGNRFQRPELIWEYNFSRVILLVLVYALAAVFAGLSLAAVLAGLGELRAVHLFFLIGSSAAAWLAGYLSFITPSGLGVREGVLTALLALVYPLPVAIVASLLFRITITLGEFGALLGMLVFNRFVSPGASKQLAGAVDE